MEVVGSENQVG